MDENKSFDRIFSWYWKGQVYSLQCIGLALVKGDGANIDGYDDNGGKGIGPSSDINLWIATGSSWDVCNCTCG